MIIQQNNGTTSPDYQIHMPLGQSKHLREMSQSMMSPTGNMRPVSTGPTSQHNDSASMLNRGSRFQAAYSLKKFDPSEVSQHQLRMARQSQQILKGQSDMTALVSNSVCSALGKHIASVQLSGRQKALNKKN